MDSYQGSWFDSEDDPSESALVQCSCERNCAKFLKPFSEYGEEIRSAFRKSDISNEKDEIRLMKTKHSTYLVKNIKDLSKNFVSLDASRPWIIYWILHACYLLSSEEMIKPYYTNIVETLRHFQNCYEVPLGSNSEYSGKSTVYGGFGGGPMQLSHFAPTYGAVMSLCIIGTPEALSLIDREGLYNHMLSMKTPCGGGLGFRMHKDGEVDTRGTYTALAVARILNILTPELTEGVAEYLLACQTYEGGFGGEPFNEAHGGYNFCALAALHILGKARLCDLRAQESWLLEKQLRVEGGFQGRTNKLVDSCYSYWQGAAVALLRMIYDQENSDISDCRHMQQNSAASAPSTVRPIENMSGDYLCNQKALQRYVLHCCQDIENGGLKDKPGKGRDFYHSCYALSGLSILQHSYNGEHAPEVYGDPMNLLEETSIVYNISKKKLLNAIQFFS